MTQYRCSYKKNFRQDHKSRTTYWEYLVSILDSRYRYYAWDKVMVRLDRAIMNQLVNAFQSFAYRLDKALAHLAHQDLP